MVGLCRPIDGSNVPPQVRVYTVDEKDNDPTFKIDMIGMNSNLGLVGRTQNCSDHRAL
jgi:hypothetical protein